jgi:hypothetical protein
MADNTTQQTDTQTQQQSASDILGNQDQTQQAQQATTPFSFTDGEGNLLDGWRDKLDDNYKNSDSLKEMKNIIGLAKAYHDTKALVGQKMEKIPDDKSSQEEWDAFYNKAGRPSEPSKYEIKQLEDENFKDLILDDERLNALKAKAHELGLSQKQLQGMLEYSQQSDLESYKNQSEEIRKKTIEDLKLEWGEQNFDKNLKTVDLVAEKLGLSQQLAENGAFLNKDVLSILLKVSEKTSEGTFVGGSENFTKGGIEDQIKENASALEDAYNAKDEKKIKEYSLKQEELFKRQIELDER